MRPGREHATDEVVGELGRRHVEDRGDEAAVDERLHRLPARPGRVEHEHLVADLFEYLARACNTRRGDPEHGAVVVADECYVVRRGQAARHQGRQSCNRDVARCGDDRLQVRMRVK